MRAFIDLGAELLDRYERDLTVEPLLNGDDLLASLDLRPGEIIGSLLREVREAQLEGKVGSREEALEWAKRAIEASVAGD